MSSSGRFTGSYPAAPESADSGRTNTSKRQLLVCPVRRNVRPRSAAGAVGTCDGAHSSAEHRSRTTAVATLVGARNGMYACHHASDRRRSLISSKR